MILHLVTDRRRLAPAADESDRVRCLAAQAAAAVAAGITAIQLREPDLAARELADVARLLLGVTRGSTTALLVNERLDVALAVGAGGVHLRGDAFDGAEARAVAPRGFVVGRSVHSTDEALRAGAVDYLVAGTVWETASKPDGHPCIGPGGLAAICAATPVPVLAIGGVDLVRAGAVARAGAAGVAAIGAFMGEAGVQCRAVALDAVVARFQAGFDSARSRS